MEMYNPPHPGWFITETYLNESRLSARELANRLGVAPSTVTRILNGASGVSAEMALRLSKVLGRSPESWMQMQTNYDLWQAKQKLDLSRLERIA